jgi:hypothetical protein
MSKANLFYRKTTALAVSLVLVVALGAVGAASGERSPNSIVIPRSEAKAIGDFGKKLAEFLDEADKLMQSTSRPASQVSALESHATRVKDDLITFQRNLENFMKKLTQSNQWTADLDSLVASKLKDPVLKDAARQIGGYRKVVESMLVEANGLNRELDDVVAGVKGGKLGSIKPRLYVTRVAFSPSAVLKFEKLICAGLFVAAGACAAINFDLGEDLATDRFKKRHCAGL